MLPGSQSIYNTHNRHRIHIAGCINQTRSWSQTTPRPAPCASQHLLLILKEASSHPLFPRSGEGNNLTTNLVSPLPHAYGKQPYNYSINILFYYSNLPLFLLMIHSSPSSRHLLLKFTL